MQARVHRNKLPVVIAQTEVAGRLAEHIDHCVVWPAAGVHVVIAR